MRRSLGKAFYPVATLLVVSLVGGVAVADSKIGPNRIKDNAIRSRHIQDGAVKEAHLSNGVVSKLNEPGPQGPQGPMGHEGPVGPRGATGPQGATGATGVVNLESDGPYPGRPDSENNLQNLPGNQGAQSVLAWTGDGGAALQSSWVMCPTGKTALGGGFGDNDGGGQNNLNIVSSVPTQVRPVAGTPGTFEFFYQPIAGDAAGSFVPNAWLVEGFNNNTSGEVIVRPHVICAEVD